MIEGLAVSRGMRGMSEKDEVACGRGGDDLVAGREKGRLLMGSWVKFAHL